MKEDQDQIGMNFLSKRLCNKSYYHYQKKKLKLILTVCSAILGGVVVVEIGCIIANIASYQVILPSKEETVAYQEAKLKNESIKKKIEIVQASEKEDKKIIEIIDKLADIKPSEIQFNKMNVNLKGDVIVECEAKNPNIFNDFVALIKKENELFGETKLNNFTTNQNGKVGTISTEVKKKGN